MQERDFNKIVIKFNQGIKNVYNREYKPKHKGNTHCLGYKEFIQTVFEIMNDNHFHIPVNVSTKYKETEMIEFIVRTVFTSDNLNTKNQFAFIMDYFINYSNTH